MKYDKECLLSIADIGFHVRWSNPKARFTKDNCFDGFLFKKDAEIKKVIRTLKHKTVIDISCRKGDPLSGCGRLKKIFEMPSYWALHATDKNYYLERFFPPTSRRMSVSIIKKDLSKVRHYTEKRKTWSARYLIQPLIRYLFVNILALHGGIMLHGSAVKIGGKVFVFSGRSGSGKTTISGLFKKAGMKVLSDECVVMCKRGGHTYAYGTPWPGGGRMAEPDGAPLAALCFISHGMRNTLRKVDVKEAAKNILHQAVVQAWGPEPIGRIFDSVNALASDTPCFEMPFVKDESAVEFVMKNLAARQKEDA